MTEEGMLMSHRAYGYVIYSDLHIMESIDTVASDGVFI